MSRSDRSDRTVHARYGSKEIVRYDRASKWFLESTDLFINARRLGVWEAARLAVQNDAEIFCRSGGRAFDHAVEAVRSEQLA